MKKILLLFLFCATAYSQNVKSKEAVSKSLMKSWVADYAMLDGLKVEKMGPMKGLAYTFKADGTFVASKNVSGTWKFAEKKRAIQLFLNGELKSTITSLTPKKMIMVLNTGAAPKGSQSLEIIFKPKQ